MPRMRKAKTEMDNYFGLIGQSRQKFPGRTCASNRCANVPQTNQPCLGNPPRGGRVTYVQGISEAWMTSGTPSPPTDLMARSTSFNPNRCVVTSSNGNRLDASCASANSQAL